MKPIKTIVIIGAGNLATHLGQALHCNGFKIVQVYSRTITSAHLLASKVDANYTSDITEIYPTADLYIYALKDDILPKIVEAIEVSQGLHVHTSGSVNMTIFAQKQANFGVLYPFQTFSKTKIVDFQDIPIFIEANTTENIENLKDISSRISNRVFQLDNEHRNVIHLAGVFACNFTNYLYTIAASLLKEYELPFDMLLPLIRESVEKLETLSPREAQTGPAVRGDETILSNHMALLQNHTAWQVIYQLLTEGIQKEHNCQIKQP